MRVRNGEIITTIVANRRMFPQEFLVTHFDKDQAKWFADATNSDFRLEGKSRNDVMDKVYAMVMTPKPKRKGKGRPRSKRVSFTITLPVQVRNYLADLARITNTDMGTYVAYLIAKVYAAHKLQTCEELPEDEKYGTDDDAWVESQYRDLGIERPKQQDAQAAIKELLAQNEATASDIAQKLRAAIEAPEKEKEAQYQKAKADLMEAEAEANERLDQR